MIEVPGGMYPGPLVIDKSVQLIGKDRPIVTGDKTGTVVTIAAPDVVLDGFIVQGSGREPDQNHSAIFANHAPRAIIRNNEVRESLFGIYLASSVGQTGLGNTTTDLFGPGPEGPVSTVRFENALEGNQEAEARIYLEKALLNKARPLPAELAKKCQDMLDERTNVLRMWAIGASGLAIYEWRARDRALFDMAGEVARVLATF